MAFMVLCAAPSAASKVGYELEKLRAAKEVKEPVRRSCVSVEYKEEHSFAVPPICHSLSLRAHCLCVLRFAGDESWIDYRQRLRHNETALSRP